MLRTALVENGHLDTFVLGDDIPRDTNLTGIFAALKLSGSLCTLELNSNLTNENWSRFLDCIGNHPKITTLNFGRHLWLMAATRAHELVQAVAQNKVLTTVQLPDNHAMSEEDQ